MSSLDGAIEQAIGVILFSIAVVLLVVGVGRIDKLSKAMTVERVSEGDIAYESVADLTYPDDEVTYAELMVILSSALQYDLDIDGVLIDADTYTPALISEYAIPVFSHYRQTMQFDADGKVSYITYRGY